MNNKENVKELLDTFGRLSFILETYVKLNQTGDHKEIADSCIEAASRDAWTLARQIEELIPEKELNQMDHE